MTVRRTAGVVARDDAAGWLIGLAGMYVALCYTDAAERLSS